jgi:membrane-associated protein
VPSILTPELLNPEFIIKTGGLIAIGLIIFAECGLLIGFFLPGDTLLFTAGFLVAQSVVGLNITVLCVVCGIAATLGPLVGYWYGNLWGPRLFNREDSWLFHKQHLVRAQTFYDRHGGKALILARFMPIVRTFAPVVAGMGSMNYPRFIAYTAVGAVAWGVGMVLLGYFLGSLLGENGGKYIEYIVVLIFIVSVVPPVVHLLRERAKERANARDESKSTLTRA